MLCVFFILFFLCLVRCLLSFFYRSSFLRVAVWKNFRERTFVLWCRCLSCVFWCCFAYVFVLFFVLSFPKLSWKNSLDVRSGVFGVFSLLLWFFLPTSSSFLFFLRETAQVVTGHTPTRTFFVCFLFLVFAPAALVITRFGRASLLSRVLSGCHSGPRAFWRFSDSLGTLGGLRLLAPSEACSWTLGGMGVYCRFFFCRFCFPLSVVFCGFFTPTRRGGPVIERGIPPGHRTRPAPE